MRLSPRCLPWAAVVFYSAAFGKSTLVRTFPAGLHCIPSDAMNVDLYQDVILTVDLPEHGLCAGQTLPPSIAGPGCQPVGLVTGVGT